ncbi:MAG: GAF domain-containing protein [Caldilineae bacterium]|nr:MAG: GAF domain-containing protein [Caldilineae bacterium]
MKGLYPKLMLLVGGVFVIAMTAILAFVYVSGRRQIEQEGLARAETLNRMAFEALYASMRQGGGREGNRRVIERLQQVGAFTQLRVVKGDPVIRQFGASEEELPRDALERRALAGEEVREVRREDGYRVVRYVTPLRVQPECQRCHQAALGAINGVISIEVSLREYESALRHQRDVLLLVLASGLLALDTITFYGLQRLVLRPVQEIQRGAAAIAEGNLDYRLEVHTGDELEALAQGFNHMAAQLQESYASLEQKVAERTRELRALNQIAKTVNRSLNLEETLPEVLAQVVQLTGAEAADIRVVQDGVLSVQASCGVSPGFLEKDGLRPLGYCLCGMAAQEGKPQIAHDLLQGHPEAVPCLSEGFRSSLSVPVLAKDQVVGVIHLASPRPHAFNGQHEAILAAVGQHVGLAIEKAHLLEGERAQRQLAETLRQASQTLSASLDLDTVLHTLLEQLGQVLVVDAGLILLREGDNLRVAAVRGRPELGMDRLLGYRLPVTAKEDFWWVIREKRALTFCQPGRTPPFAGGFRPIEEVNWCLVVPLLRGDEAVGLLALEQLDHCYDEEEEPQIAMAFANHAVMAIENARLYAEIKALNEELEARVERRTQELNEAREALARQADQLRHLLNKTIRIQEEERDRIAQDIHDGVSQLIMGALYETQAAKVSLVERPEVAQEKLHNAQEILRQVKTEMRRIIYDLHPAVLSQSGLVSALQTYRADYQTHTGIHCILSASGPVRRLAPEQERAVYRIIQEALHNVAQHAGADQVAITLAFTPERLTVTVEDNGCGFDEQAILNDSYGHLGLVSMRERAQSIGGRLEVHSRPGRGTRIVVQMPIGDHVGGEVHETDQGSHR